MISQSSVMIEGLAKPGHIRLAVLMAGSVVSREKTKIGWGGYPVDLLVLYNNTKLTRAYKRKIYHACHKPVN